MNDTKNLLPAYFETPVTRLLCGLIVAPLIFLHAGPASAQDGAGVSVVNLVRNFIEAQRTFDVPALKALTAENYVEISPVGELDEREQMLQFYLPGKNTSQPVVVVDKELTRLLGDAAIHIATLTYTWTAEKQARVFAVRATFVAHRVGSGWKLVSAQYTGIRPRKPS